MGGILQVDTIQNNNATTLITQTNSTTLTFGVSGQNIVIPSGVTFNTASATVTLPSTINATTINVTTVVLAAGAAGTPSLTTSGDTNTGIFFPTADTIAFTEGGTEAMRIDSSGNIGIGTTAGFSDGSGVEIQRAGVATLRCDNSTATSAGEFRADATGTAIDCRGLEVFRVLTGGAERMRIDSSGRLGVGVTSPAQRLQLAENTNVGFVGGTNNAKIGGIIFGTDSNFSRHGMIDSYRGADAAGIDLRFYTMNGDVEGIKERMRIDSGGTMCIGKTTTAQATQGINLGISGVGTFTSNGDAPIYVNRLTNDGILINFRQDNTDEGNISVSGTTVSYNGFTGSHWSRFIDGSKPDVLRGTVLESLDQMTDWYAVEFEVSHTEKDKDGNDVVKTHTEHKPYALKANEKEGDVISYAWNTEKKDEEGNDIIEQVQATIVKEVDVKHVMSKISDTVEAKNIYGVFSSWDNDDLINNDFYVASVGSYVVRIKAGQVVAKGDLLQSNGDGTAKVQADDIIRASTFAKVLSNTVIQTYEDGSFIVPCSLMC